MVGVDDRQFRLEDGFGLRGVGVHVFSFTPLLHGLGQILPCFSTPIATFSQRA
jgi:hypothetical protein